MRKVRSQALDQVQRSLKMAGPQVAVTEFDDGVLQQSLDVGELVRRGGALAGTEGLWSFEFALTTVGAGSSSTQVGFHDSVFNLNGYPRPVPDNMDVWMLYSGVVISAAAALGLASISMLVPTRFDGNDSGAPVASAIRVPLHTWTTSVDTGAGIFGMDALGQLLWEHAWRIPRDSSFLFRITNLIAATTSWVGVVGLFPAGMGQDGAV